MASLLRHLALLAFAGVALSQHDDMSTMVMGSELATSATTLVTATGTPVVSPPQITEGAPATDTTVMTGVPAAETTTSSVVTDDGMSMGGMSTMSHMRPNGTATGTATGSPSKTPVAAGGNAAADLSAGLMAMLFAVGLTGQYV